MRPFRNLKIASLIQEELSKLFVRELNFDDALVTIINVEVDEDLLHSRVKLGIIPYEKGPEVYSLLQKHRGRLQHMLLKKLNIKPLPHLAFEIEEQK
ncbi:MAG: ribosome-binding factor A [Patescibacteria group bacterium]|nr:ribosome-binding factor A [Patescibacteria group bacterium]